MFTLNGNIIGGTPLSPLGVVPYGSAIGCSIPDSGRQRKLDALAGHDKILLSQGVSQELLYYRRENG